MNTPQPLPPGDKSKIDELSNKTIRVMCAEAMGFHKMPGEIFNGACHPDGTWVNRAVPYHEALPRICPNYPEDANAALTLCDWMSEHGWSKSYWQTGKGPHNFVFHRGKDGFPATADTFAMAVCRAFLLANNLAQ